MYIHTCKHQVYLAKFEVIQHFYPQGQHLCKFIGPKESVYIRKEFNVHWVCWEHQHGCCFIVLEHQYGHGDIMRKHFMPGIVILKILSFLQLIQNSQYPTNLKKCENLCHD